MPCARVSRAVATVLLVAAAKGEARTWNVHPDGTGDAPTIQAAIDRASPGDDILLAPGTYTWTSQAASGTSMVRLRPGLWLHSQDGADATILDAQANGRVLLLENVGAVRI